MKVVILAGGMGTRISEESHLRPKPMIEIGDNPILWHIMKIYSYYGFHEFIICCGYKGQMIKEYFMDYYMIESDVVIDLKNNTSAICESVTEPWNITLANTGLHTNTAGRVRRIQKYVGDEPFMLTYGDGVADVDIPALIEFHKKRKTIATITAAKPSGRWGTIQIDAETGIVESIREKDQEDEAWVNAGFAVMEPEIFHYLTDDTQQLEKQPYEALTRDGQMSAYRHEGFWQPMDTMRDKKVLEELWESGNAPWKLW
ncbi:MAG: glucose-1-phosphate cytidylyltransferase [bacterium]|nr:glucose-1-phosphate cytidylyltransferase [bacterium]